MRARRVLATMPRLALVVAVLVVAALLWIQRGPARAHAPDPARGRTATAAGRGGAATPGAAGARAGADGASTAGAGPVAHVTRLASAGERRAVADRIARARAARGAIRARPLPQLPDPPAASLRVSIRDAMREAIPDLAGCYTQALPTLASPDLRITAQLTLTGDPDVGTLIDAKQLFDHEGKPLPPALDDCLRARFQELELPPLAEGDQVEVHYPFVFSNDDPGLD